MAPGGKIAVVIAEPRYRLVVVRAVLVLSHLGGLSILGTA